MTKPLRIIMLGLVAFGIASCGSWLAGEAVPTPDADTDRIKNTGKITGDEGIVIFGGNKKRDDGSGGGSGISVNAFLWRASLDSISFMPLASADLFGGVIITDWYSAPDQPNERFKLTVYVLDRQLRSDALKVAVFRQTKDYAGNWFDAPVDPQDLRRSGKRHPDARTAVASGYGSGKIAGGSPRFRRFRGHGPV